jgi:anti-sigma regulatory factor (Ser/Thr protein kinase)
MELMRRVFPAEASAVVLIRRCLRARLEQDLDEPLVDAMVLVVSELATNAVVHARTPFEVVLTRTDGSVRLAVTDHSTGVPAHNDHPGQGGGFGLHVVDELTDAWGYDVHAAGKTVWCEVRL